MNIDHRALDEAVRKFLKSRSGRELIEKNTTSFVMGLLLSLVVIVLGGFLCCTIIMIRTGLKMIWAGLTLKAFSMGNSGSRIKSQMEDLRGMIMPMIIVGPGEDDEVKGLALCAFDDISFEDLTMLAENFGDIYVSSRVSEEDRPLKKILRDDTYQEGRRRRVPEAYSFDHDLYLCDVAIQKSEVNMDSGAPLIVCAMTGKKSGAVLQLPWSVAAPFLGKISRKTSGREEHPKASQLTMAIVAMNEGAKLSVSKLVEDLQSTWDSLTVSGTPKKEKVVVSFDVGQQNVIMGLMPAPIPWSDLEGPCKTSSIWPEATEGMRHHRSHVIVTVTGKSTTLENAVLLTKVVASMARTCQGMAGVTWGTSGVVASPKIFQDCALESLPDSYPVQLWVDFRVGKNGNKILGFTSGLELFGLRELETTDAAESVPDLRARLMGVASYLLDQGPVIHDGDTIGQDANEQIIARYAPSAFGRKVEALRLVYKSG